MRLRACSRARDGDAGHRGQPAHHATCGRPSSSRAGGGAAVDGLALRARTGITCRLRPRTRRSGRRRRAARWYRTAQEALTNITKHARASRVRIDLSLAGGVLSLEISDDGRGLSWQDLARTRSFGIRGLHGRVPARWAAGSTCPAARGNHADSFGAGRRRATPRRCRPGPVQAGRSPSAWGSL